MIKYTFNDIKIKNSLSIIFLCGVKFNKKDKDSDKRVVLKRYLQENPKNKVLILEEYFEIASTNPQMLSYKDINLNSLFHVESLTAFLADVIFIIHESLSTAAELGVFASNKDLYEKICLLTPNEINVEEDKSSGFINLAFLLEPLSIANIEFYPSVEVNKISDNISNYHTYFYDNKIGSNLGNSVEEFVKSTNLKEINLSFSKATYAKALIDKNSYHVDTKSGKLIYYIDYRLLKYYIIAIFSIKPFRPRIRKTKDIKESIKLIAEMYRHILKETIINKEGKDFSGYKESFNIIGGTISNIDLDVGIAYILYVLHSLKLIKLPIDSGNLVIADEFKGIFNEFSILIDENKYMDLGGYDE